MKKLLVALFSLILLATACKKGNDTSKDAADITVENIAGSYKITSIKSSVSGSPFVPADYRDACQKDDVIELKADNNYAYHDLGTVCQPAGDITGLWQLDGTTISCPNDDQMNGEITSFNGSTMELTLTSTEGGISMIVKTTLKKQ
jgi:hypothetical protein